MSGLLTRDQLLMRAPRRFTLVDLPGGGKVRLRSLTEKERSAYEADLLATKGGVDRRKLERAKRRLIVLTVVDDDGNPVLQPADAQALEEQDCAITSAIYTAARAHCGFDEDDIEGLVKNSEATHVESSP